MKTVDVTKLIPLLQSALTEPSKREDAISQFQNAVLGCPEPVHLIPETLGSRKDAIWEILGDLAWDLDFYEENPSWRRQDPSYYGEERLAQEILDAFEKLRKKGVNIPQ